MTVDLSITVNGMVFENPFVLGSGPPGTNGIPASAESSPDSGVVAPPVDTDDEVRVAMKMAHDAGVQNVLLTRGSRGDAYFSNGEDIWYAKREFNIKLVSSVCAGDYTLAAFLHKWYRDRDNVEEAMKLAMATGANVAESVGLGDFGRVNVGLVGNGHIRAGSLRKEADGAPPSPGGRHLRHRLGGRQSAPAQGRSLWRVCT